ncbi:RodZ domain-containing protein [Paraferrimonas sp. SM1919]|uniref:RodZ domain-containing protein n=1 Tax=Paraferrimonas sp. SM1919 TaxID=2662263 RepID=UPI0013D17002|nr:RodZ domain-containing protein [Paraferrimonas sp. SM1919]
MTEKNIELQENHSPQQSQELTIGEQLVQARLDMDLTTNDVAQRLNLRVAVVQELERDNFDIDALTYTKGYLRNYAKLVQIDAQVLLNKLDNFAQNSFADEPDMQSFSRKTTAQSQARWLKYVSYFIAISLGMLFALYWMQQNSSDDVIELSEPSIEEQAIIRQLDRESQQQVASTAEKTDQQSEVLSTPLQPMITASESESVAISEQTPQANALAEQKQQTQAVTLAAAAMSEIEIIFNDDCWIQVTDADGEFLVDGLKLAGHTINVSGQQPFSFVIGAPKVVNIIYNGEQIDLSAFPEGKVARFSWPKAE